MKRALLIGIYTFFVFSILRSQQVVSLTADYQQKLAAFAPLYSGKLETGYSPRRYIGHPYWETDAFRSGSVCFEHSVYQDVLLRYDAFAKQLVVSVPVESHPVIVDLSKVSWFEVGGNRFVPWKDQFVLLLHHGKSLRLMQCLDYGRGAPQTENGRIFETFKYGLRYLLVVDGEEHWVHSRASLVKLFPAHKEALNDYAKQQKLNFKSARASALSSLVSYAEQLITHEK